MAGIAVTGIIEHDGKVLVGKKINLEGHFLSGRWHLPGGGIKPGESDEEALIREMKEETNLDVRVVRFLGQFQRAQTGVIVKCYLCTPLTLDLVPGDDLADAKFVTKEELLELCKDLAPKWPKDLIDYLKN